MGKTKTNSLSSDDLCKIIKACRDAGVCEFKLGDLEISLGASPKVYELGPERPNYEIPIIQKPEEEDRVDSMMDLMLSDPAAYEDAIIKELAQDG